MRTRISYSEPPQNDNSAPKAKIPDQFGTQAPVFLTQLENKFPLIIIIELLENATPGSVLVKAKLNASFRQFTN